MKGKKMKLKLPGQYSIMHDKAIEELCNTKTPMISPFVGNHTSNIIVKENTQKALSYGLGSFGYDIRLSPKDFKIYYPPPELGHSLDPKNFDGRFIKGTLHKSSQGNFFIIPGHSYGLGVSLEKIDIPKNIIGLCIGKSTYARCGVIANLTPLEPGWRGHVTLEFSNASPSPVRMYADEGVVQILFFRGESPTSTYADRKGKYQDQKHKITLPK